MEQETKEKGAGPWQNKICDKELRGIIIKFYNVVNFATEKKYRGGSSQERGIKWRVNGLGNGMFIPPHTFDNFHFKPRNFLKLFFAIRLLKMVVLLLHIMAKFAQSHGNTETLTDLFGLYEEVTTLPPG